MKKPLILQWLSSLKPSLVTTKCSPFKQHFLVAFYLVLLSITIRLPFFFPDVIDWDESTLILMGQSILDGHLPYTELWDNKPPLAFLFYAVAIATFGKSIISVRIAGTLCVALVSFFTYLVGKTLWNNPVGILSATLFVILASLLPSGQATMTEHVALVPLVGALSLLVTRKTTLSTLFFSGILMAIASLIRLNLAYVTVIIGLFALFVKPTQSNHSILQRGLAYAAGGCLVILLTYIPYAVTGYQQVWFSSVILAPLNYANSQLPALGALEAYKNYIWESLSNVGEPIFGVSVLMWIGGLLGIVCLFIQWFDASVKERSGLIWLFLFLLGTWVSLLKGGAAHTHYLIQILPFMALTSAAFLNLFRSTVTHWLIIGLFVFILVISVEPITNEYEKLISRFQNQQELTYGSAYEIASYLNQEDIFQEPVYMMSDQIVYWLIDAKPPSKLTTHPSNIAKEYLLKAVVDSNTSTEIEMGKILAQKPKFIVKENYLWYLSDKTQARLLLAKTLRENYRLVKQIRGKQIYRRTSN